MQIIINRFRLWRLKDFLEWNRGGIVTTNYFWGQDVEMSQFYRVPKALLYTVKNGWIDEDGKTYIRYSVADIMADTGCGKNKILKCLKELEEDVQEIYDLIVVTVVGKGGSMTISGQRCPRELVKSRFLKLNVSHIEYVMECLRKNTTKVYNIKAYLLAALFNAGATMSNYYRAEVNHDMPQFAG